MSKLLLANPRKKARTAAQKRATAALVALNRSKTAAAAAPARRKRRTVTVTTAAPAKRRRVSRSRARTVARRSIRRIGGGLMRSGVINTVKNSVIGASGALAVDVAFNKLPLPAFLKTGQMAHVSKAALAVGVGMLVSRFANKDLGNRLAEGSITVTAYTALRGMVGGALGLSGIEDFNSPYYDPTNINGMGFYNPALPMNGMGEYVSGADAGMGMYMENEESGYQY